MADAIAGRQRVSRRQRLLLTSIHDEELGASRGVGAVGLRFVGDLVAHARREDVSGAIAQLDVELTFQAEEDVALHTPVIRQIPGHVLDHPDPDIAKRPGAPEGGAGVAGMLGRSDLRPVSRSERDVAHFHRLAPVPEVYPGPVIRDPRIVQRELAGMRTAPADFRSLFANFRCPPVNFRPALLGARCPLPR